MPEDVRPGSLSLRFLAAPTDVAFLGGSAVPGGRVLEWVDKAAYACAVGWSRSYCVTAYVGDVQFKNSINSGDLVEVHAQLVLTGRSSLHIRVAVSATSVTTGARASTTSCLVTFVAVDDTGRPKPVPTWNPATADQQARADHEAERGLVRKDIEAAMAQQTYSTESQAPSTTLRFLAAPTDVNWGGKTHGGTVMRWIDEAAWVCAVGWSGMTCLPVYSGGIRFYRPIPIGNLVELDARLLHTGRSSMHVAVHVRSADPATQEFALTTHCLIVFVALAGGVPEATRAWEPQTDEDRRLDEHAVNLMRLRRGLAARGHDVSDAAVSRDP